MKIYTFTEEIVSNVFYPESKQRNYWKNNENVDEGLNRFLERNKENILEVETHIQVIRNHNNGGYNDLIKITIVKTKGEE